MNKLIIVTVLLFGCFSCSNNQNRINNEINKNCKIVNLSIEEEKEIIGGARSKENFREVLSGRTLGTLFSISNRYMYRNNINIKQERKLVFYIYIAGGGNVTDIETLYSDFEDCGFIEKIKEYLFTLDFGEIEVKNDISIFPFDILFRPKSKNSNKQFNSDSVPRSRGTSLINDVR